MDEYTKALATLSEARQAHERAIVAVADGEDPWPWRNLRDHLEQSADVLVLVASN
jgi:hypothetical protein